MLYESPQEQQTVNSTNAINPLSSDDVLSNTGIIYNNVGNVAAKIGCAAANITGTFTNHMCWAMKNQFNFDKSMTNRINLQIPCPLFYSDELLHFGSDGACQIVLNVDGNWYKNLIQIAGSNACVMPALAANALQL